MAHPSRGRRYSHVYGQEADRRVVGSAIWTAGPRGNCGRHPVLMSSIATAWILPAVRRKHFPRHYRLQIENCHAFTLANEFALTQARSQSTSFPIMTYYRIEMPTGAQLHLSFHDLPDAAVLKYQTPTAPELAPPTIYLQQYEVRLPKNSEARVIWSSADFKVSLVGCSSIPFNTDPISSIYSPPRTFTPPASPTPPAGSTPPGA